MIEADIIFYLPDNFNTFYIKNNPYVVFNCIIIFFGHIENSDAIYCSIWCAFIINKVLVIKDFVKL